MIAATNIALEVHSDSADLRTHAADLRLRLGFAAEPRSPTDLRLILDDERLELRAPDDRPGLGLWVDLVPFVRRQFTGRRAAAARGGRQPLVKAIGALHRQTESVLDATAGLGQDAALLACMGYRVLAVERSPIIFALLEDGLRRALAQPDVAAALDGRLSIVHGDAREIIKADTSSHQTRTIYIDPMFPPKRKASALAKKSIRMVREIVGDDADAAELVAVARAHLQRVVVKRPTHAPPLKDNPTMSYGGKLARYDVYVEKARRQ